MLRGQQRRAAHGPSDGEESGPGDRVRPQADGERPRRRRATQAMASDPGDGERPRRERPA